MATIPSDINDVRNAMEKVKEVGGIELAIEMAAVGGFFEATTRVTDCIVAKESSRVKSNAVLMVMVLVKHRKTIGLVGAAIAATAVIAFRLAKKSQG